MIIKEIDPEYVIAVHTEPSEVFSRELPCNIIRPNVDEKLSFWFINGCLEYLWLRESAENVQCVVSSSRQ